MPNSLPKWDDTEPDKLPSWDDTQVDFSNVKLNPYQEHEMKYGKPELGAGAFGGPVTSDFTRSLYHDLPTDVGNLSRATVADIGAGFAMQPEFSGNIPAALRRERLPIDTAISDAAKESALQGEAPWESTAANLSQDVSRSLPLIAAGVGAPAAVGRGILAGFTGETLLNAPDLATELGEEEGKPRDQQDPEKLAKLRAAAIGTVGVTGLGALGLKGVGRDVNLTIGDHLRTFARDIGEKPFTIEPADIPPIRRFGAQFTPNALHEPGVAPLVDQAFAERAPGHIAIPGEPAAVDLIHDIGQAPRVGEELRRSIRNQKEVEGGRLPIGEHDYRFADEPKPGFLKTAEDKLIERGDGAPTREIVTEEKLPEPLRDTAQIVRDKLQQRDLKGAVESMLDKPAEAQRQIVDNILGVDRKKVPLSAAELTIFNEIWEKVLKEKGGQNAEGIRSDTGQPPKPGEGGEGGEANSGGDVQQTPPGTPPGQLGGQGNPAPSKVAPAVEAFAEQLKSPQFKGGNKLSNETGLATKSVADLEALANLRRNQVQANREFRKSIADLPAAERLAKMQEYMASGADQKAQLARESIEVATDTGSWEEAPGSMRDSPKLGERPLNWRKNPEVADWLKKNGEDLGISLPKELSETAPKPEQGFLDKADAKLGELQTSLRGGKLNFTGLTGLEPALLDAAITAARVAIKATKSVVAGTKAAVDFIKEKYPDLKFNAEELSQFIADTVRKDRSELATGDEKMRKLSERGSESPSVPEGSQDKMKKDERSFYNQQSMEKVQETVSRMSDSELSAVGESDAIFTAAKLEQAQRLFDSGKEEAGYKVFQDLSERLTRLGQVINQAKLLQSLKPENVVKVLNQELKKQGKDPLTNEQAGELADLSRDRIETKRSLDKATDQWSNDPTDANAKLAEAALNEANAAALAEQQFAHRFQSRSMAGLLKAILQGNLLTPISEVANLVGNMSFVPFRMGSRTIAAGIDAIDATLRNRPRESAVRPGVGTAEMVKGLIRGMKQVPEIMLKGTGDVIKGESRSGLHPLEAWTKMFAKDPQMPTVGGKVPFSDRVKLAIEGTLGVPAELMLRGLGAGDAPFRSAARSRIIAEQAKLKGVPDAQLPMAQKFPELFFDKDTQRLIESETARDLFQRESETLQHVTSLLGKKGSFFDLLVSFVAPYKLTPWNIIGEILSYNPLIAAGKTALEAKRGNARAAELSAGKMVVGGLLTGAGWWLYKKGLLAPSMDQSDEAQKARILAGEVLPPNHINISGLKRAISGGDAGYKPGDETVDVFRAGGLAGSMFYMTANIGRDLEKKPDTASIPMALLRDSVIEQARFGVNQSFLKGIAGVLQSVTSGDTDNFVQAFENSVLSIPLPNTLSTISKVRRDYKPDLKTDQLDKEFSNIVKNRLGFTGMDKDLPVKRGLWGEPVLETPKDRNAILYHFFDISKNRQVTDDPVPLELYRLWRSTGNTAVIPSIPSRTLTVGKSTYGISPDQYSRLVELVGKDRRAIADKLVVNPNWAKLPDEDKIKILGQAYELGLSVGKVQFAKEFGPELEKHGAKAGFSPK